MLRKASCKCGVDENQELTAMCPLGHYCDNNICRPVDNNSEVEPDMTLTMPWKCAIKCKDRELHDSVCGWVNHGKYHCDSDEKICNRRYLRVSVHRVPLRNHQNDKLFYKEELQCSIDEYNPIAYDIKLRLKISSQFVKNNQINENEQREEKTLFKEDQYQLDEQIRNDVIRKALESKAYFEKPIVNDQVIDDETNLMIDLNDSAAHAEIKPFFFEIPVDEDKFTISLDKEESSYKEMSYNLEKVNVNIEGEDWSNYVMSKTENDEVTIDLVSELTMNREVCLFETATEKVMIKITQGTAPAGVCELKTDLNNEYDDDKEFSFDSMWDWCKPMDINAKTVNNNQQSNKRRILDQVELRQTESKKLTHKNIDYESSYGLMAADIVKKNRSLSQSGNQKCQMDMSAMAKANSGTLNLRMQLPFEAVSDKAMKYYDLPLEFGEVDKICGTPIDEVKPEMTNSSQSVGVTKSAADKTDEELEQEYEAEEQAELQNQETLEQEKSKIDEEMTELVLLEDITSESPTDQGEMKELPLGSTSCRAEYENCVLISSSRSNYIWDTGMFFGANDCMQFKLKQKMQEYADSYVRYGCVKKDGANLDFYVVKKDCTIDGEKETVFTASTISQTGDVQEEQMDRVKISAIENSNRLMIDFEYYGNAKIYEVSQTQSCLNYRSNFIYRYRGIWR